MRKVYLFLTVFISIFVGLSVVCAKEMDLTDASISIKDVDVSSGDKEVTIEFSFGEELTNVDDYVGGIYLKANSCIYDSYDNTKVEVSDAPCYPKREYSIHDLKIKDLGSSKYSMTFKLSNDIMPGKWIISSFFIDNGNGSDEDDYNFDYYKWDSGTYVLNDKNSVIFNNIAINLINSTYENDNEVPIIDSISIVNSDYEVPGKLEFKFVISDNYSEKVSYQIDYRATKPGDYSFHKTLNFKDAYKTIELNDNGKGGKSAIVSVSVPIDSKYEKYYFWYISLEDDSGNFVYYANDISKLASHGMPYQKKVNFDKEINLDIIPTNLIEDNKAPVLKSYNYSENTIVIPEKSGVSQMYITIEANDDGVGFDKNSYSIGDISIIKDDHSVIKNFSINYDTILNKYIANVDFSVSDAGKWYVDQISIYDSLNNTANYFVDDNTLEKKVINVEVKKSNYDLELNISDDCITAIKALKKGDTVYIDTSNNQLISKELLKVIKEKGVIVTFGYFSSSYVEFILDGKDIDDTTKDINLDIDLFMHNRYNLFEYNYGLPNIQLDNSLSDDKANEKLIKESKETIEDYFNTLKKLGFKNTDNIKKSALSLYDSLFETEGENVYLHGVIFETIYDNNDDDSLYIKMEHNSSLVNKMKIRIYDNYYSQRFGNNSQYLFKIVNKAINNSARSSDVKNDFSITKIGEKIDLNKDGYFEFNYPGGGNFLLIGEDLSLVDDNIKNVPTGDNILTSIFMMISSVICIVFISKYFKKVNN